MIEKRVDIAGRFPIPWDVETENIWWDLSAFSGRKQDRDFLGQMGAQEGNFIAVFTLLE